MQQTQGHCMAPNNPIYHLIHWWIYTTSFTMKYYHSKTQGGLTLSIFYVHCKTDHNNNTIEVTHTHNFQKGQDANRNRPGYKCSCYWHDTMVIIIKQVMLIFFFHCIHANKHSTKVLFYSCVLPVWLSPLEYVPLSLYYSYLTLPITHLHTYYYFKKIKNSYTCDTLIISAVIPADWHWRTSADTASLMSASIFPFI